MEHQAISKEVRHIDSVFIGAPVDVASRQDDPVLALDPARNNDFRYDTNSQSRCPFAAHTRKTYPRSDLPNSVSRRILRRGIQYGPEVTDAEAALRKSSPSPKLERGLLFVCYQSNVGNGFQFIQQSKSWLKYFVISHADPVSRLGK